MKHSWLPRRISQFSVERNRGCLSASFWHHHHAVSPFAAPSVGCSFRSRLAALAHSWFTFSSINIWITWTPAWRTSSSTPLWSQPTISAIGSTRYTQRVFICGSPLFSGNEKLLRAHQAWSLKVATFYDLPGIPGGLLRMA